MSKCVPSRTIYIFSFLRPDGGLIDLLLLKGHWTNEAGILMSSESSVTLFNINAKLIGNVRDRIGNEEHTVIARSQK